MIAGHKKAEEVSFLVESFIYDVASTRFVFNKRLGGKTPMFSKIGAVQPLNSLTMNASIDDLDDPKYFSNLMPSDLEGPLDIGLIGDLCHDESPESLVTGYNVSRYRAVSGKRLRRFRKVKSVVRWDVMLFDIKKGTCEASSFDFGLKGDKWNVVWPVGDTRRHDFFTIDGDRAVKTAYGIQFANDYQWFVKLRNVEIDTFPILIPTTPEGSKEVFRLRDIPNGKKRRAALRNWVISHMRRNHKTSLKDIDVIQHLRGTQQFVWSGLECTIIPSPFDLRRAAAFREERKSAQQHIFRQPADST